MIMKDWWNGLLLLLFGSIGIIIGIIDIIIVIAIG